MNQWLSKYLHPASVAVLCAVVVVALAMPFSVHADGKKKGKKKNNKQKQRMTICHYDKDGDYVEKSLPLHAAMKHLAKHDHDKEPMIGDDGSESCITVEAPPTTCRVNVDGAELTVSEYLASLNVSDIGFNTDANSCGLTANNESGEIVSLYNNSDGLGLDIFFGGSANRLLIGSEAQYNDCAYDIETAAQTNDSCPEVFQLNE